MAGRGGAFAVAGTYGGAGGQPWMDRRWAVDLVLLSIARSKLIILIDEEKSFAAFKRIS